MANISQITIDNNTFDIKDTQARNGLGGKQDVLTPGQNISITKDTTTGETVISSSSGGSIVSTSYLLTLTASGWDSETKQQTVEYELNTDNRNVVDITVGELPLWSTYNVYAVSETATGITFQCDSIPEEDLTFRITSMEKEDAPPYKIVTWADGTDKQIKAMIDAADAGEINLADYWSIGDERTVHLSAITVGDALRTAQSEQDVVLVLMNEGYPGSGNEGVHFVWGQKDCLSQTGKMNASAISTGSWNGCAMRIDLNDKYYNALPDIFRGCLKQFNVITAQTYNGSTNQVSQDYISLFAEKEIFGSVTRSNTTEAAALSQIEYYKTASNRIKHTYIYGTLVNWWERSPMQENSSMFCEVATTGEAGAASANYSTGVAPFGCI